VINSCEFGKFWLNSAAIYNRQKSVTIDPKAKYKIKELSFHRQKDNKGENHVKLRTYSKFTHKE